MARKVLLADDSVTAQNMGRKILTDAGYEVVTVNNGSAALKKISEAHPDLIVLDVYMPGYSGLEVCQRIKESRDTNQIPVLLTVGKLEPFKQDEARRVRADAFIIKPFEASELTAALSRLESKLTAGGAPQRKEGRNSAPATMESFERTASAAGAQFGDEESGWKSRIKFPSPGSKPASLEPEPDVQATVSTGSLRDLVTDTPAPAAQKSSPQPAMERPMPAGIPQDITPDEIAAITAAAARVQAGISVGKNFEQLSDLPASTTRESSPSSAELAEKPKKASAPVEFSAEKSEKVDAIAPVETLASSPATVSSEIQPQAIAREESVAAEELPASVETAQAEPAIGVSDTELVTTLAIAPQEDVSHPEPVTIGATISSPAAVQSASAATSASKPRWVAEEIPLEAQEAVLVLEREMHKAYAAFAAAEHGQKYESAPVDRNDEPMFATMGPPTIGTPLPMMESASSSATNQVPSAAETSSEPAPSAVMETKFHEMPYSAEVSKPPAPPFAPAGPACEGAEHSVAAFGGPHPLAMAEAVSPPAASMEDNLVARATAEQKTGVSPEAISAVPESKPATPEPTDKSERAEGKSVDLPTSDGRRDSELAAAARGAWANWREVRDSVLGPKAEAPPASPLNPAAELEELKKLKGLKKDEPASASLPEAALAAAASADSGANSSDPNLSSIVDNMLAELKPKLMAELAEKLKQEKGKK